MRNHPTWQEQGKGASSPVAVTGLQHALYTPATVQRWLLLCNCRRAHLLAPQVSKALPPLKPALYLHRLAVLPNCQLYLGLMQTSGLEHAAACSKNGERRFNDPALYKQGTGTTSVHVNCLHVHCSHPCTPRHRGSIPYHRSKSTGGTRCKGWGWDGCCGSRALLLNKAASCCSLFRAALSFLRPPNKRMRQVVALAAALALASAQPTSKYFLGAAGDSCTQTCLKNGMNCNPAIQTNNSTALFQALGVTCVADARCVRIWELQPGGQLSDTMQSAHASPRLGAAPPTIPSHVHWPSLRWN